jgi:membrane complex biogenesis BtpA family protein
MKNVIIGAIHLPPLLGYPDFPGFSVALKNAISDLRALERGGVDAIIIENNYDIPHYELVPSSVAVSMAYLGEEIKKQTKLPVGVSVLWNDYRAALSVAKLIGARFIRVPVFVDKVKTNYGIVEGNAKDVVAYRKKLKAEDIALYTDIHVKHAKLLSNHTLTQSAKLAIGRGSDALIITGKWTGDAPDLEELKTLRNVVGKFPILCGSGVDSGNVQALFRYANGAIVSTSLKQGSKKRKEINVKPYTSRLDLHKTKQLVDLAHRAG